MYIYKCENIFFLTKENLRAFLLKSMFKKRERVLAKLKLAVKTTW